MPLKVIGTGLFRTGTMSTKLALEQLGFGKCFHMVTLVEDKSSLPTIQQAHQGKDVDWNTVFTDEYQSALDFPSPYFFEQLIRAYPDAKVLLNVRDADAWYESAKNTVMSQQLRERAPQLFGNAENFAMAYDVVLSMFNVDFEKERSIRVFNEHIGHVKRVVPADKLLVYDVKEGWEPLCRFLGVDVPDAPFPNVNQRKKVAEKLDALADAKGTMTENQMLE